MSALPEPVFCELFTYKEKLEAGAKICETASRLRESQIFADVIAELEHCPRIISREMPEVRLIDASAFRAKLYKFQSDCEYVDDSEAAHIFAECIEILDEILHAG